MAQVSNVITLNTKSNLSLTVDGMIRSKAHQAIYDLPGSGNLDIGLRWQFWKNKLYCIFSVMTCSRLLPSIPVLISKDSI